MVGCVVGSNVDARAYSFRQVCGDKECELKVSRACDKVLVCGHFCCGVSGETECLPCLQPGCTGEPVTDGPLAQAVAHFLADQKQTAGAEQESKLKTLHDTTKAADNTTLMVVVRDAKQEKDGKEDKAGKDKDGKEKKVIVPVFPTAIVAVSWEEGSSEMRAGRGVLSTWRHGVR
jgi:hypothetical protein